MGAAGPEAPLVTAVMIFLNGEKYIAEAIESVLAQTCRAWELVLVDDGSTDGATTIARSYAERHPGRIRYLEHPGHANRGMSASRNAGVAEGRGQYISFLDADDIWLPDRLERFLEVARDFPSAGMIYGPTLYWFSWAVPDEMRGASKDHVGELSLPTRRLLPAPMVLREFLLSEGGSLPGICSLLVRRDAYEAVGGFEPSFRGLYEDQVFLSKMAAHHPIVVIDEVLDYYRQHEESCCSRALVTGDYDPNGHHPARATYLRWLSDYLPGTGITDPVIVAAIARQLWPYDHPLYIAAARQLRRARFAILRLLKHVIPEPMRRALRRLQHANTKRRHGAASALADHRR